MKFTQITLLSIFFTCQLFTNNLDDDYVSYVNPLIGTDSSFELSKGNTYPAIARPWGMNFWTPQTGKMGDGWAYQYQSNEIVGFKQTHQPSPWINDYGAFSIMPSVGEIKVNEKDRKAIFSHQNEIVEPHYYKVFLENINTNVEFTVTDRSSYFKIKFPKSKKANIIVDAFFKKSEIIIIPDENKILGVAKNSSGGTPKNFANYFVIKFSQKFYDYGVWSGSGFISKNTKLKGEHVGSYLSFDTSDNQEIEVKISSSFISHEQAIINLNRELPNSKSFENILREGRKIWNKELSKIKVKTFENDKEALSNKTKFYSCLYRTILFPRAFHEFDVNGKQIHYSPYNGKVLEGPLYTDNGFWDTFRAVFPFYTIFYPDKLGEIIQGIMVNPYKESGWLPEWSSPGHRDCMIGSNSASIIAEAYIKGIKNFDIETAYEGVMNNSNNEGPLSSVGRKGVQFYNKLGYIPYDVNVNENVARTLEYSYNDFSIWKLAELLNRPDDEIELFKKRANYYKNVFDKSTNFMRGKLKNGEFQRPFKADAWGGAFTEGSSWHYTWSVLHDPEGLMSLMGGRINFIERLDEVFTTPPTSDFSYYGFKIHEILEMELLNMGQYAHGNQPIQHAIYFYNFARQPWKTQQKIRHVMDNLYGDGPDGYCGDEDNGQTSAWFVFSAMGFYPVAPVTGQYVIGSPLFESIKIELTNNKTVNINVSDNEKENVYIASLKVNNQNYNKNWLDHSIFITGGKIDFSMSPEPNYFWGSEKGSVPYSMSLEKK
tara:strand:+ start:6771 stop:9077 length:2307 start_codon:yes stop_codon:yes gene_type:complete